jgi:hypothetical protein
MKNDQSGRDPDAAITARARAVLVTLFSGAERIEHETLVERITAALCAVRDETLQQIDPYLRHATNCESEPHDYMGTLGPTGKPCTCGLDAIVSTRAGGGGAG